MERNSNAQIIQLTLGFRLRAARISQRLTRRQVLEDNGINVAKYERDWVYPDLDVLTELARLYNVSTDYLLGLKPDVSQLHETKKAQTSKENIPIVIRMTNLREQHV